MTAEAGKKRKGLLAAIIVILAISLIALIAYGVNEANLNERETAAWLLYKNGEYEQAAEAFAALNGRGKSALGLERCNTEIKHRDAEAQAKVLMDSGEYESALALLKADFPESKTIKEVADAYAQALLDGDSPDEAVALLQSEYHESRLLPRCRQAASKNKFLAFIENGQVEDADQCLSELIADNRLSQWMTDEEIKELRALRDNAKLRELADSSMDEGYYKLAYDRYKELGDSAKMLDAVGGLESQGEYVQAFAGCVQAGDLTRAEQNIKKAAALDGAITNQGAINNSYVDALRKLGNDGSDKANALRSGVYEIIKAECLSAMEADAASRAYAALEKLQELYEPGRDEISALMAQCLKEPPAESKVLQSIGGDSPVKGLGEVTITVYNKTYQRDAVVTIGSEMNETLRRIYLKKHGIYTFHLPKGYYYATFESGDHWFGDTERFGANAIYGSVVIQQSGKALRNPTKEGFFTPELTYMDGSYSMTIQWEDE